MNIGRQRVKLLLIYSTVSLTPMVIMCITFKHRKRIVLISFQNLELLLGRSSSPVGYGIGIAEVVGSNPTRSISFCDRTTVLVWVRFLVSVGQIVYELQINLEVNVVTMLRFLLQSSSLMSKPSFQFSS